MEVCGITLFLLILNHLKPVRKIEKEKRNKEISHDITKTIVFFLCHVCFNHSKILRKCVFMDLNPVFSSAIASKGKNT